jgi:hypothetical protein
MPPDMTSKQPEYGKGTNTHFTKEYLGRISSFSQSGHDDGNLLLNKSEPWSQPDIPEIN